MKNFLFSLGIILTLIGASIIIGGFIAGICYGANGEFNVKIFYTLFGLIPLFAGVIILKEV